MVIHLILQFDLYDYEQDLNVVNDNNFLNLQFLIFDYLEKKEIFIVLNFSLLNLLSRISFCK